MSSSGISFTLAPSHLNDVFKLRQHKDFLFNVIHEKEKQQILTSEKLRQFYLKENDAGFLVTISVVVET